jgi:dTDP-4-dehydrorhamnose 3,5-epimerase
MLFLDTPIPNCFRVQAARSDDFRGSFVKPFNVTAFKAKGATVIWREMFYSQSVRNVLRGFHVTAPPAAGAKLVVVISGTIIDAGLDLRRGSPTEGLAFCWPLDADKGEGLLYPPGVAHAFYVTSRRAIVGYLVEQEYLQSCDIGVRWDTAGLLWPSHDPIVSLRDKALPALCDFKSPFLMYPQASHDE